MIYYPTVMARYSLFVLKVPLNTKKTNKFDLNVQKGIWPVKSVRFRIGDDDGVTVAR